MSDNQREDKRLLLRVRLPDGAEAVFKKAGDSSTTLADVLSSVGGRFQQLAERIRERGENLTEAEDQAVLDDQIRELTSREPHGPYPTVRELEQRIDELERRLTDLEGDKPRQ